MQNFWTLLVALLMLCSESLAHSSETISELEKKIQENNVKLQDLDLEIEEKLKKIDFSVVSTSNKKNPQDDFNFVVSQKNTELLTCYLETESLQSTVDILQSKLTKLNETFSNYSAEKSTELNQLKFEYSKTKDAADKCEKMYSEITARGCLQFQNMDGIHEIDVPNFGPLSVNCESGWTVIVNWRHNRQFNFARKWNEYKAGFGFIRKEFFIGLEHLHQMTSSQPHELYIQFENRWQNLRFAQYDDIVIGNEIEGYKLKSLGQYSGTFRDVLNISMNKEFAYIWMYGSWFVDEHTGGWWSDIMNLWNHYKATKMFIRPK
ncbi:angiopoietin-related protein 7-like isoform X2 [Drosophila innubila]|uniref:angiopoietin-related protein 7-like isoform X2 n=1 Tax=Drosophila innubila TaxID=198719 RepID=UPI00148DD98A|nr:angiopoietin-related protein 7-like isoform X2 [Drosophila innubila]